MICGIIKKSNVLPEPNTWIGGVAARIPDVQTLASLNNWSINDILNFQLDGFGNISFFLNRSWGDVSFGQAFFFNKSDVTFIISTADFLSLQTSTPRSLPNCIAIEVNALNVIGGSNFRGVFNTEIRLPLANYISNQAYSLSCKNLYLPSTQKLGTTTGVDNFFDNSPSSNLKFYCSDAALTNNNGGIEGDIDIAINTYNWDVRFVSNFTAPSAITDLSASNITATTCDLNFTPPSSLNALDFYEVYIDDGTGNLRQLKVRWQRISASGDTISNLVTGTTYKIKVIACDEFWNRSEYSNEIQITTL